MTTLGASHEGRKKVTFVCPHPQRVAQTVRKRNEQSDIRASTQIISSSTEGISSDPERVNSNTQSTAMQIQIPKVSVQTPKV